MRLALPFGERGGDNGAIPQRVTEVYRMFRPLRLALPLLVAALACSSKSNSDLSSLTLSASSPSAPADGMTAITITLNAVGTDGATKYTGTVELTCNTEVLFGTAGVTQSDSVQLTNGVGTETIRCAPGSSCIGSSTIHASLLSGGAGAQASIKVTFLGPDGGVGSTGGTTGGTGTGTGGSDGGTGDGGVGDGGPPVVGGILFVGTANPYMGINYETNFVKFPENTFTFEVTDTTETVAVPNVLVNLTMTPQGAAAIANLEGAVDGGVDGEGIQETSDSKGMVTVKATSGQKSGTVTITASVVDAGFNAQGSSAIIGTQPSLTHSTLSCGPVNLPVYAVGVTALPCETTSAAQFQTTCVVNLADRFGQVVQVPVPVQFFTEAGSFVEPSVATPAFGQTGTGVVAGQATNVLVTTSNVPIDVTPLSAEPSYFDADPATQRCGPRTYNPRDGLVSIIAVFTGEESFVDTTGTGVYLPGDPFTDMPQPFVDRDDSSAYESGDECPGASVAGQCGGPNGSWDGNSNVYVETRILYSGAADNINFFDPSAYQAADAGELLEGASDVGSVTWGDINLNVGAYYADNRGGMNQSNIGTYNVVVSSGPMSDTVAFPSPGSPAFPSDTLGMSFTQLTQCNPGMVQTDAGAVASSICLLHSQVSQFSGGFTSQYKISNSNTQLGKGGPFTLTATQHLLNAQSAAGETSGVSQ